MADFLVTAESTMTAESTVAAEILDVARKTLTLEDTPRRGSAWGLVP
jgi:hypothetical protein